MYGRIRDMCKHIIEQEEGEYFLLVEREDKMGWILTRASSPKVMSEELKNGRTSN